MSARDHCARAALESTFRIPREVAMAKAKRARRSSIRTMEADGSALEALEALERAEQPAERVAESSDGEATAAAVTVETERD